jgi:TPR repeat protein
MTSLARLRKLAEDGNAEGQFNLAICYEKGKAVAQDILYAQIWYERLISQHAHADTEYVPRALYRLAVFKEVGVGGHLPDLPAAIALYARAAALGHDAAKVVLPTKRFMLAESADSLESAVAAYAAAADAGHAGARTILPHKLFARGQELEKAGNIPMAIELFKRAAQHGHAYAKLMVGLKQFELAESFERAAEKAELANADEAAHAVAAEQYAKALELFAKAAAGGLPNGRTLLANKYFAMGSRHLRGLVGAPRSVGTAAKWLEQAAVKGHEGAQIELINIYLESSHSGGDAEYSQSDCARWLSALASKGDATAQFVAAKVWQHGFGVRQDTAHAQRWLELAAQQGHAEAAFTLGGWYLSGEVVQSADRPTARRYFEVAAAGGHAAAMFNMAVMLESDDPAARDMPRAFALYRAAAEKGHAAAMFNLSVALQHGEWVPQDETEAIAWLESAAKLNHAGALYNLGVAHSVGMAHIQVDDAKAFELYERAAALRHADACFAVGKCYHQGKGCRIDLNNAAEYWTVAAKQDHELAQEWLLQIASQLDKRTLREDSDQALSAVSQVVPACS